MHGRSLLTSLNADCRVCNIVMRYRESNGEPIELCEAWDEVEVKKQVQKRMTNKLSHQSERDIYLQHLLRATSNEGGM